MISDKFILLAVVLNILSSASYLLAVVKNRAQPNRVTWFFWGLAPLIAFAAELNKGVGLTSLFTLMTGLGPLAILVASFLNKKSYWRLGTFDFVCGGLAIVGLIAWLITRQGNLAIVFSIAADALAATPTLRKAFLEPGTEDLRAYAVVVLSSGITMLTIKHWTLANYGFPLYVFVICSVFTFLIGSKIGARVTQ